MTGPSYLNNLTSDPIQWLVQRDYPYDCTGQLSNTDTTTTKLPSKIHNPI